MRRLVAILPVVLLAFACSGLTPRATAAEPTPAALGDEGVIYPRNSPEARAQGATEDSSSLWGTLGVVVILGGAGLYLLKRGQLGNRSRASVQQRLAIEETRPLGNKQFLAVAAYGERRILLGVCNGRIDFLCRLDDSAEKGAAATAAEAPRRDLAV